MDLSNIDRLTEIDATVPDNTDKDIIYNAGFSFVVGLVVMVVFVLLRMKLPRLYQSNLVGGANKPRLPHRSGAFGWLHTVLHTSDSQLLSFAGFDAFLQVQTIKLMLGMLIAISIPMLFILIPVYHFAVSDADLKSQYMRFSILHCSKAFLWFPFAVCYVTSLLIFYFVYLFYRNYALIRQAYLKDPSALTSCLLLQWLIGVTGSEAEARKVASLHNRSVILEGISEKVGKEQLRSILSTLNTGFASSITFINPRDELIAAVTKRNKTIIAFEEACMSFLKAAIKNHCETGADQVSEKEYLNYLTNNSAHDPPLTKELKMKLLASKLINPSFHAEFRTRAKNKEGVEVDALQYYFERIKRYDKVLDECIDEYTHGYEVDSTLSTTSAAPTTASIQPRIQKAFFKQATLISFQKISWIAHNLKDLKLTFYGTSQSAVVIMESARGASAMSQIILSRRPFSLHASMAPAADDVLWDNLQLSPSDRTLRQTAGEIMFVLVNLFFIPVVSALSSLTQLKQLIKTFPRLGDFIPENSSIRSGLQGFLAPLAVNAAFALAPYLLYYISFYQGKASKTALQLSLVRKFSWFLFFQSFVVIIIAASLVDVVNDLIAGKYDRLLGSVRETFPLKSSFFFNIIIQKAFLTLPVMTLKVVPLSKHIIYSIFKLSSLPRNKVEQCVPEDFMYGQDYPMYMVTLLQITLAFMTITPVSIIAGLVYFGCAYLCFRHMALFNYRTKHESGGSVWPRVCDQIMLGCVLNQVFTLLHFSVRGAALQAIFITPLIFAAIAFSRFLKSTFTCRIKHLPQTMEDEEVVDKLVQDLLAEQSKMLIAEGAGDPTAGDEQIVADFVPIKDIVSADDAAQGKDTNKELLSAPEEKIGDTGEDDADSQQEMQVTADDLTNPYTNPVLFKRYAALVLHPALFPLLNELE